MEKVTIYEIPSGKIVVSEYGVFGDGTLESFDKWFSAFERPIFPKDYLYFDNEKEMFRWFYLYEEGMDTKNFEVIDFKGGLYAVACGIDNTDTTDVFNAIYEFVNSKEQLVYDESRFYLGNIPTSELGLKALGYNQMNYFVPVKIVE